MILRALALGAIAALVVGCGSSGSGKGKYVEGNPNASLYKLDKDTGPSRAVSMAHVPDAVPRYEPRSRGGNKSPYRVMGKTYYVLPDAAGYKQRGTASWYGKKFHGHTTSNGEIYDMYAMSAAHKSLPLPSFVRVTNLDNGRQVVVRVNDRGPFHGGRLIDLSYAAAYRLDMLKQGTARVEVEIVTPQSVRAVPATAVSAAPAPVSGSVVIADTAPAGRYFQLGAFSTRQAAANVQQDARTLLPPLKVRVVPVQVKDATLYRVQAGPLDSGHPIEQTLERLNQAGYPGVRLVDLN